MDADTAEMVRSICRIQPSEGTWTMQVAKRRKRVPRPEEFEHTKFPVEQVLYNDGQFSVVYGCWEEEQEQRIGMRWNGQGDDPGYPKLFSKPVWFLLPE